MVGDIHVRNGYPMVTLVIVRYPYGIFFIDFGRYEQVSSVSIVRDVALRVDLPLIGAVLNDSVRSY